MYCTCYLIDRSNAFILLSEADCEMPNLTVWPVGVWTLIRSSREQERCYRTAMVCGSRHYQCESESESDAALGPAWQAWKYKVMSINCWIVTKLDRMWFMAHGWSWYGCLGFAWTTSISWLMAIWACQAQTLLMATWLTCLIKLNSCMLKWVFPTQELRYRHKYASGSWLMRGSWFLAHAWSWYMVHGPWLILSSPCLSALSSRCLVG